MKKTYSKFLALLLSIFMCLQITPIVHARESKSLLYNNLYGDAVPTDVYFAAESHANDLIDLAVTSILTDTKKDELQIGKPFVVFSAVKGQNQDHIFYFPVSNKDKIEFLIYVIYANNECSSGCTTTYVDKLNRLAINGKQSSCLLINDQNGLKCLTKYNSSQYEHYLKEIKNIYKQNWTPSVDKDAKAGSDGFTVKHEYEVRMQINRAMTCQNQKPICWAACIATIIKYRNYNKYKDYTAEKIAKDSGIGIDTANSAETVKAMSKYYKGYKSDDVLWYPTYSQLMRDGKPVMIKGALGKEAHFVVGIGFKAYGGYRQAIYYNPQDMRTLTFEYKNTDSIMYFEGYGKVYSYIGSIHN